MPSQSVSTPQFHLLMKTLAKFLFVVMCLIPAHAFAALGQRDLAREAQIEAELGKRDSSMVEPFRGARVAYDKGDFATAKQQLLKVVERLPEFDPAWRRLGAIMEIEGDHKKAMEFGAKAVALNRSSANLAALAGIQAFSKEGHRLPTDQMAALAMLTEARRLPYGDDAEILVMSAQLALSLERMEVFRENLAVLEAKYPDEMVTHYFAAIEAATEEHWVKADREIRKAGKLGLAQEDVDRFLDSGVRSRALMWGGAGLFGVIVAAWIGGLVLLSVTGGILSRVTLRHAHRTDTTQHASAMEIRLRSLYRFILNIAGLYYYVSLPIVILMVIAVVAAVILGFLAVGFIPIKITAILVIGALITIGTMCKSLFIKVRDSEPGRVLARHEAEGLWRLTDEVAATLGTRPIDEIRVTVGTDLAVYEKGKWRERVNNKAKRVLILGAAVLNGFKQEDFRCVLAHEYGHFSNRDTAGGDIALRVRNDMVKFYLAMVEAGQATALNLAFHFLRIYHSIFHRISHGATRLQEILADRVAALAYGPAALEGGLRHVIRQSLAFEHHADKEINDAIASYRPIHNLYDVPLLLDQAQEKKFAMAINRPTTSEDTHPAPLERFRLVANIPVPERAAVEGEVWDLFNDRDALIKELMDEIEANVARQRPAKPIAAPAARRPVSAPAAAPTARRPVPAPAAPPAEPEG